MKQIGRPRSNFGKCGKPKCKQPARVIGLCRSHYKQERRLLVIAEGICTECLSRPIGDGLKTVCEICAAKHRTDKSRAAVRLSLQERRQRLIGSGMCIDCGKFKPEINHTLCSKCLDDRCNRERERRLRNKQEAA